MADCKLECIRTTRLDCIRVAGLMEEKERVIECLSERMVDDKEKRRKERPEII